MVVLFTVLSWAVLSLKGEIQGLFHRILDFSLCHYIYEENVLQILYKKEKNRFASTMFLFFFSLQWLLGSTGSETHLEWIHLWGLIQVEMKRPLPSKQSHKMELMVRVGISWDGEVNRNCLALSFLSKIYFGLLFALFEWTLPASAASHVVSNAFYLGHKILQVLWRCPLTPIIWIG